MRRLLLLITLVSACTACMTAHVVAADTALSEPVVLEQLQLRDSYNRQLEWDEIREPVVVLVFLGVECPLARLYSTKLNGLLERFPRDKVRVIAVDSNRQDTLTEIAAFKRQHGLKFDFYQDPENVVADAFQAQRTPEAVVLDKQRRIRYRGRIDDQYGVGIQRKRPSREDLVEAVNSLVQGKPVEVSQTEPVGCLIGRVTKSEPSGEITYARQIAPILNRRCVECHRDGEIAPFSLQTYEDTVGWGPMMAEVIQEGRMPPWNANPKYGHFRNDARLSSEERQLLLSWIADGAPSGDLDQTPKPPQFVTGWRIEEPDRVIAIRDEPFAVQAEGVVDYQYFEVDPQFETDMYVSAIEARPDNRAVVHHIIVYAVDPDKDAKGRRDWQFLVGYAPGAQPPNLPDGYALRIPAKSKLIFELHYTPNGTAQRDRSDVGLKFTPLSQVTHLVKVDGVSNHDFEIPPQADHHQVVAERVLKRPVELVSFSPHMHLRGKAFRYEAEYPDGNSEVLLDVPQYDFNWQLTYVLDEVKRLPGGTKVTCTAYFDNSRHNPNNPDPAKTIKWGPQSWDEMMIGFYTVITPVSNP